MSFSSGESFRILIKEHAPLQILGAVNAYTAMLAERAGGKALYLSGAGVANASYGLPDLGITSLSEVLEDARRITDACPLPLLVDIDTGWGHTLIIARTIQLMEKSGIAAVHLEDQMVAKRCGHRPNKGIISTHEMCDRIKAAVDARVNEDFVIMARTDAYAQEGMKGALERAHAYIEAGADMLFPEALSSLSQFSEFTQHASVPVLANMTEFGKTPLYTREELKEAGIQLILYPLTAFRAMSFAALHTYQTIIEMGTQKALLSEMQSRDELYDVLGYHELEEKMDESKGDKDDK